MQSTVVRRALSTVVALTALGAGVLAGGGTAAASTKDGELELREFGLYYNSSLMGSVLDLYLADSNLADDRFPGYGSGQGQIVDNNAASYFNRDRVVWYVYTGSFAGGVEGSLPANYYGNASATFKNQVSSAYHYKAR
ncbi:hypothetical protein ACFVZH_11755 [Streptomyces sp. NPDC059534]|uniref:hypothetical protein n=1 Tax=Streptomyces sp. NPDC059534 TaxID=3346859 RepID=UPI00368EB656